jgi:tRNA threonylcarbamoyl adenosine modification protein YeaZ
MLILAADTSLPILSVALIDDAALIGAVAFEGKGSRNEKLLPAIDWLLTENGVDRQRIELFAVTRGPGSFTGVRIGLATMQGLAIALGRNVCTMSTHEAIAYGTEGAWSVVDDAGRGELYVSSFENGKEVAPPHLGSRPQGRVIEIASFLQRQNAALSCARRALALEQSGEGEAHRDVTPIYVRLAEAEVKLQQRNA